MKIKITKVDPDLYNAHYNGNFIGDFMISDDGYFHWWPSTQKGYLPAHFLREIADELDNLNHDWNLTIQGDFCG